MATDLDGYDKKILAEVQENARVPQSELGERVSLSAAAVNRRLKRLVEERVIEKYTAVVAPNVGYRLTIVVNLEVESEQLNLLDAMKRSLFFGNKNVKRFKTLVAMDRVKVGLDVPIQSA